MDRVLTTSDNPWNPFSHWDEWFEFDESFGYNTCGLLARYTVTSNELSEEDYDQAVLSGMLAILGDNPMGPYRIVAKDDIFPYPPLEIEGIQDENKSKK